MSAHESGVENNGKHQSFEIHAVRLTVMLHLFETFCVAKVVRISSVTMPRVWWGWQVSFAVGTCGFGVPSLFRHG